MIAGFQALQFERLTFDFLECLYGCLATRKPTRASTPPATVDPMERQAVSALAEE